MASTNVYIYAILCMLPAALSVPVQDGPKEVWNYTTVRSDAHMFWWLYYTSSSSGYKNAPLIMWLQGGPGGSSTGFGNFEELGPLDDNLQPRNTTWLSAASLLFVDNPVGTGYSYVTADSAYTTTNEEIADDLVTMFKAFMKQVPDFQTIPFYIFCESYGGKMTAGFAAALRKAISSGELKCNFKGIALGDSWISAEESVLSWAPYLFGTSMVDRNGYDDIMTSANEVKRDIKEGNWNAATKAWAVTESTVEAVTGGVNFYNIMDWGNSKGRFQAKDLQTLYFSRSTQQKDSIAKLYQRHVAYMQNEDLYTLMNGPIMKKLKIIPSSVTWGGQSSKVFEKLSTDFMKPVVKVVDNLISNCSSSNECLKVVVYSGQLDLIVDVEGTINWVKKLSIYPDYTSAPRNMFYHVGSSDPCGYVKTYKNFGFYWILDSGHMVPKDNGPAALKMVKLITGAS